MHINIENAPENRDEERTSDIEGSHQGQKPQNLGGKKPKKKRNERNERERWMQKDENNPGDTRKGPQAFD